MISQDQFKTFLEAARLDANLQEQLKAAKDADSVAAIAKSAGYAFCADDLKTAAVELSDQELESAAGGITTVLLLMTIVDQWALTNDINPYVAPPQKPAR